MNSVVDIKKFVINRAKAEYSMSGQVCIPVEKIDRHGDQILKAVLKDIDRSEERKVIFHAWNNLETASVQFCSLVSRSYPGKHGALVDEVLKAAFNAFEKSALQHEPEVYSMVRYLNTLADAAYQIQKVNVYTLDSHGSPISWSYFTQPLAQWAKKSGGKEVYFSPAPEPTADAIVGGRNYLCARIMTINDIGKLALIDVPGKNRVLG